MPFNYKDKVHHGCIQTWKDFKPWCATKVDESGTYTKSTGSWDECNENCPKTSETFEWYEVWGLFSILAPEIMLWTVMFSVDRHVNSKRNVLIRCNSFLVALYIDTLSMRLYGLAHAEFSQIESQNLSKFYVEKILYCNLHIWPSNPSQLKTKQFSAWVQRPGWYFLASLRSEPYLSLSNAYILFHL